MQQKTVRLSGRDLVYYESESDSGRPIIFLTPGEDQFEGSGGFAGQAELPWKTFLLYSEPGSPEQTVDKALDLANALNLDTFVLAGASSGANAAIVLSSRVPHRVDALILIEPTVGYQGATTEAGTREGWALHYPVWEPAAMIRCPTLILRGAQSDAFPADALDRMRTVVGSSIPLVIPGAGHQLLREAPDAATEAVRQFLFGRRP